MAKKKRIYTKKIRKAIKRKYRKKKKPSWYKTAIIPEGWNPFESVD